MKILMIVTWYGDKKDKFTGNFHTDMAKALLARNDVAIYFPFDRNANEQFSCEIEDGILVFRGSIMSRVIKKYVKIKNDFENIQKIFNPDVIHAHVCQGAGVIAMYLRMIFNIPYIITEHAPVEMITWGIKSKIKYWLVTKHSQANIAVSPDLRDKLNCIFKRSNFIYINNGVNDPLPMIKTSIFECEENVINCSVIGGLYSKDIKGLQYLLPAMQRIVKDGYRVTLHVCGGGKYLDYFKQYAVDLNISDNIMFHGMCDKETLYEIVNNCDFNISASLFESAGVAVEEACLLGKPQVITNSGGANSLIPDKFAIKTGKSSVDELYKGIKEMLVKFPEYNQEEIREYGLKEFLMEQSCYQYENIYAFVVHNR